MRNTYDVWVIVIHDIHICFNPCIHSQSKLGTQGHCAIIISQLFLYILTLIVILYLMSMISYTLICRHISMPTLSHARRCTNHRLVPLSTNSSSRSVALAWMPCCCQTRHHQQPSATCASLISTLTQNAATLVCVPWTIFVNTAHSFMSCLAITLNWLTWTSTWCQRYLSMSRYSNWVWFISIIVFLFVIQVNGIIHYNVYIQYVY